MLTDQFYNCLFRRCSEAEIISLFTLGELYPHNYDFISLSQSDNIPNTNDGDYIVVYDKDLLLKQGAIEIEYNLDFMNKNPNIFKHINIECFLNNSKSEPLYTIPIEHNKRLIVFNTHKQNIYGVTPDTTYEEFFSMWKNSVIMERCDEEEFIIKKIKIVPNLIKTIVRVQDEVIVLPITPQKDSAIFIAVTSFKNKQ